MEIFRVKKPHNYCGTRKDDLHVTEVGRFNDNEEPMTVWSVHSGDEIPPNCKIPELNPPTSDQLPLSLRTEQTSGGTYEGTYHAVEKILTWAEAVGYSLDNVDIVVGRSAMKRMSVTSYYGISGKYTWSLIVYRYRDTICIEMTGAHGREQPYKPISNRQAAWSAVFDEAMKTGGRGTPGYSCEDTNVRVPRLVELGSIRVLSSGKVHSQIMSGNERDVLSNYVEVKLWKEFDASLARPGQERFCKELRSRDTWALCSLLGMQTVMWGERNEEGDLTYLRKYQVEELEENQAYWQPEHLLSFLENLLIWLKNKTENDMSYTLEYDGRGDITLHQAEHEDFVRIIHNCFPEE